jgi:hypothetical protein
MGFAKYRLEERKAAAMEKRAEAQNLMADALNNVASAVKQITIQGAGKDFSNLSREDSSVSSEILP